MSGFHKRMKSMLYKVRHCVEQIMFAFTSPIKLENYQTLLLRKGLIVYKQITDFPRTITRAFGAQVKTANSRNHGLGCSG